MIETTALIEEHKECQIFIQRKPVEYLRSLFFCQIFFKTKINNGIIKFWRPSDQLPWCLTNFHSVFLKILSFCIERRWNYSDLCSSLNLQVFNLQFQSHMNLCYLSRLREEREWFVLMHWQNWWTVNKSPLWRWGIWMVSGERKRGCLKNIQKGKWVPLIVLPVLEYKV